MTLRPRQNRANREPSPWPETHAARGMDKWTAGVKDTEMEVNRKAAEKSVFLSLGKETLKGREWTKHKLSLIHI